MPPNASHNPTNYPRISLASSYPSAGPANRLRSGIDPFSFDTFRQARRRFLHVHQRRLDQGWLIPPEYSCWDLDAEIREGMRRPLREIMEGLVKRGIAVWTTNGRKLRDYWLAAMDEPKLEKQGVTPLAGELQKVAGLKKSEELPALLADFESHGLGFLFSLYVDQDEKQSDRYVVHLGQGGLGLPEPEYYLDDTEEYRNIRAEYRKHVEKMLAFLGDTPAEAKTEAEAVIGIETSLAKASRLADGSGAIRRKLQFRKRSPSWKRLDPAM